MIKFLSFVLCLVVVSSCKKKDETDIMGVIYPIDFEILQPFNGDSIDVDSIVNVDLLIDENRLSEIESVELFVDSILVETISKEPIDFEWKASKDGGHLIEVVVRNISGQEQRKTVQITSTNYLYQWLGKYEGVSKYWITYPVGFGAPYYSETIQDVIVETSISQLDSALHVFIQYEGGNSSQNDIKVSPFGVHNSTWGHGSSGGSLDITFSGDSLIYDKFQKCGMPCQSGEEFIAHRD